MVGIAAPSAASAPGMPVRAIEVLALTDSEGKGQMEADPGDQERDLLSQPPSRSSTQAWHEAQELREIQEDAVRMQDYWDAKDREAEEEQQRSWRAREWDDWAMWSEMEQPPPPRKRQRLVVRTFESGSSAPASSSHEILLPVTGMVQFQLYMENGNVGDASSDASTRIVPGAVEWVSPMASQAGEGGMPHAVEGGVGVILQDDPGPALVPTQLEHPSVTDSDVIESFGGEYGEGTRDAEQNAGT